MLKLIDEEMSSNIIYTVYISVCVCLFMFLHVIVLDAIIGKLCERISAIFLVLADLSVDLLPSLQFILLFYAFGSASEGEFNMINYMDSFRRKYSSKTLLVLNCVHDVLINNNKHSIQLFINVILSMQ